MERAGTKVTGRAIAYIKDALDEINIISESHIKTQKLNIVANKRFYKLPNDCLKVLDIRCKHHDNEDGLYKSIPRAIYEPATEDSDCI